MPNGPLPRAYRVEGRAPEHRPREAQRAACRSAAARRSRQPRAAASAESEGPVSPVSGRERVCVSWGAGFFTFSPAPCCDTTLILVGWTQASELPSSLLWQHGAEAPFGILLGSASENHSPSSALINPYVQVSFCLSHAGISRPHTLMDPVLVVHIAYTAARREAVTQRPQRRRIPRRPYVSRH